MADMENQSIQLSEEDIIKRVLLGQREFFGLLVRRYWSTAVALAVCKCGDPAIAEDLVQNSFIKAYQNLSSLRDKRRFGGWLSKIVIQECRSYHRGRGRRKLFVPLDTQAAGQISACAAQDNPGLSAQQIEFVHTCVRGLPEGSQQIVLMRFVGGFTLRQIAEQLGKNAGTVRVCLHRALKILKDQLAPMLEEVQL